jgi:hypothetical protein
MTEEQKRDLWWASTRTTEPTIERMAKGLSTVRRWLNRTLVPWTTLQHSLAAEILSGSEFPEIRLAFLLHDAEDMIGNDVPHPAKTPEQAVLEQEMRQFMWERSLRIPYPSEVVWDQVHPVDDALAVAEAHLLMPPEFRDWGEYDPAVGEVILSLLDMTPREAVFVFTEMVTELRKAPQLRALEGRV